MKKFLKIFSITLVTLLLVVIGYLAYVLVSFYRIEDNVEVDINNNQNTQVALDTEYTITSFNIGFGAYEQPYSFFMDTGVMEDGTKTQGKHSRALGKQNVIDNTNGSINQIKNVNPDFCFFQEVDTKSNKSYKVNQKDMVADAFNNYSNTYAINYHSSYLFYPFHEPIGKSNSGIMTLSKYKMDTSVRRSFPLSGSTLTDLTDLDRCFMITRFKITDDKQLVLINLHMSAYDEGGKVRAKQMQLLNEVLEQEKNNYVIVGGDFNHILVETNFPTTQKRPDWVADFPTSDLPASYTVRAAVNAPTCRGADIPYEKGVNYTVVIDGFITNDKITVVSIENLDCDFMYSDHNPVKMVFKLNA